MSAGTPLFPAIDLRGGHCVRLMQGDYGRETVYGDDPVAQALAFHLHRVAIHECAEPAMVGAGRDHVAGL